MLVLQNRGSSIYTSLAFEDLKELLTSNKGQDHPTSRPSGGSITAPTLMVDSLSQAEVDGGELKRGEFDKSRLYTRKVNWFEEQVDERFDTDEEALG